MASSSQTRILEERIPSGMRLTLALSCFLGWGKLSAACATSDWATAEATCRVGAEWATHEGLTTQQDGTTTTSTSTIANHQPSVELLIGVKTSVIHGATARRAIRDTWANRSALPANVRVVFLGCAPDLTPYNASEATRVLEAIATERARYDGDMLVHELASCRDAYDDLVNKVLAFFQWSAEARGRQRAPSKTYLMVADDDIYLRVEALMARLEDPATPALRFYGGQVWAVQYRRAMEPLRHPSSAKYFLSHDHYAMSQLPPFANGPHYLLSADVAYFVGRSRAFFRGVGGDPTTQDSVGTFDDVSVALWMLAMQIHPEHLQGMGNIRDSMCRNDFVSYADFSTDAIYRIHHNIEQERPACLGFSYETWIKPYVDPRIAQYHREKEHHMVAWESLKKMYGIRRFTHQHDIVVSIELRVKDSPIIQETSIDYVPATRSFFVFCEILTAHVARELGVLAEQFVFVCEELRMTLLDRIESSMDTIPSTRPIFSLLLHNLRHDAPVPMLKVAVTADTRHALIVVENLLTQAYAGMELQIFDEATYSAEERDPDIVIFSTTDAKSDTATRDMIQAFANKYSSRLVLLHPRDLLHYETTDQRVIVVTSSSITPKAMSSRHLYLPLVSTAFGSSEQHSPVDLLDAYNATSRRPATFRLRQFCVDDYAPGQCDYPHRAYFFDLLNALDRVDVAGACTRPRHQAQRNDSLSESITTHHGFFMSHKIKRYEQFKFTIAFEDAVNVPGHVGDTIVAAFLAGSIPIYYGHSPTVEKLFNAKAFIDCGVFASLRGCAKHVLAVHSSPSMSEAMRREPPIVNVTAFYETFSWHPDVAAMVQQARATNNNSWISASARTMSEQFKVLIESAP